VFWPWDADIPNGEEALAVAENDESGAVYERGRRQGEREQREREVGAWRERVDNRLGDLESNVAQVTKDFAEFVAIQRAIAASSVSNRTFWLGVAAVIATVVTAIIAGGGHA
jgi:hypothetical protein